MKSNGLGRHGRRSGIIVATFAMAAISAAALGPGVASADVYAGMTYADAKSRIASMHQKAVIATVSGDQVATDDCIVVSSMNSMFLDASGEGPDKEVLVNLNCTAPVAAPGKPGNSAASPEGRKALKERQAAHNISKNPAWCNEDPKRLEACKQICDRTGLCEV